MSFASLSALLEEVQHRSGRDCRFICRSSTFERESRRLNVLLDRFVSAQRRLCAVLRLGSPQKLSFPSERDATSTTVLGHDLDRICKRRLARPIALPFAAQADPRDRNGACLHHSPNRHVMSFRGYTT